MVKFIGIMSIIWVVIIGLAGFAAALFIGRKMALVKMLQKIQEAERQAKKIMEEAEHKASELGRQKYLESKEKYLHLKSQHEAQISDRNKKIVEQEVKLKHRENTLNQKETGLDKKNKEIDLVKEKLNKQITLVNAHKELLDKKIQENNVSLEKIAGLSAEEAKQQLLKNLREETETKALSLQQEIMDEAKRNANKEARKLIVQTIQRVAAEQAMENAITSFSIENDDIKGQIIGREGRNIRAIETATGVDLIVDDTPGAIVLSCFDPLRREIARISLQRLVSDGRIHPARIEEVVEKTRAQIEERVMEIGERTIIELGIHGLYKELVRYVGKMRFRSSYGQNLLQHSREVANLCSIMAAEMGVNPKQAKRAGLLHDIGKVPDEASELSHAVLGMKIAEKYGEKEAVVNAIGAHHDEIEMLYTIAPVVQACDSISGARPGARREIMQQYIQRIKDLEDLAQGYSGVEKAFAIQAGRELRVIVEADKVSDQESKDLSFKIAQQIQNEMTYPGQIKVTVIREKRAVYIAR